MVPCNFVRPRCCWLFRILQMGGHIGLRVVAGRVMNRIIALGVLLVVQLKYAWPEPDVVMLDSSNA